MRALRAAFLLGAALLAGLHAQSAHAVELGKLAKKPVTLAITNSLSGGYHFDNRNDTARSPALRVDDRYGDLFDHLSLELRWWRLEVGARTDLATYFGTLSREAARDKAARESPAGASASEKSDYANTYFRTLHGRYRTSVIPSKLWISYRQPDLFKLTVGDFYTAFGRGLVLSVRKVDELALDTTIRGIRISSEHEVGRIRAGVTAVAGVMNPLRVDESSGRTLIGDGHWAMFGSPKTQDLKTFQFDADGKVRTIVDKARPNYLEDSVFGGRLYAGPREFLVSAQAALLVRRSHDEEHLACDFRDEKNCDSRFPEFQSSHPSLGHRKLVNAGVSLQAPNIADHGEAYLEIAGQQLRDPTSTIKASPFANMNGLAVYGQAVGRGGPVSVTVEGKHYRKYMPWLANIDAHSLGNAFYAPEFNTVSYTQAPTVEAVYVEPIGAPYNCNSSGRLRVDGRWGRQASVYAWAGYGQSLSEYEATNYLCEKDARYQTNTWDSAVGGEFDWQQSKSFLRAWAGLRSTVRPEDAFREEAEAGGRVVPNPDETNNVFYQEGYARYALGQHFIGAFSGELQGVIRRRYEPIAFEEPWTEGENYLSIKWAPHITTVLGHEFTEQLGCRRPDPKTGKAPEMCHYFNGGIVWRGAGKRGVVYQVFDTVNLFVGERRGAVRCAGGTCRTLPPYSGVRVELVSRF